VYEGTLRLVRRHGSQLEAEGRWFDPLIVGSLFSFGAFVAQLWTMMRQRWQELLDRLLGDAEYANLERLARTRRDLLDRIEKLQGSVSGNEAAKSPESESSG